MTASTNELEPVTVLVTERFPYGAGETYLEDEIDELRRRVGPVLVYPIWPHPASPRQARHRAEHPAATARPGLRRSLTILLRSLRLPYLVLRLVLNGLRRWELRILAVELVAVAQGVRFAFTSGGLPIRHVHAYWLSYPASCARTIAHLLDVPWSATGHRYDLVQGLDLDGKAREASALRFVAATSQRLFQERSRTEPRRSVVLPLAQDVPDVPTARPVAGPMVVCVPANLLPVKGHEIAIRALRILLDRGEEACLLLAGDGPRRSELERLVEHLGLREHVTMPGRLDREHLFALYREGQVTAVALPSLDLGAGVHEGLPIALVEAMAHGVPVVATDSGGIPELLEPSTGVIVPQRDPHALADALAALHRDQELRRDRVAAAHRAVFDRFDRHAVVPVLAEVLLGTRSEVAV